MVAPVVHSRPVPAWHAAFLAMLPKIVRHACIAFRGFNPDACEDAVQEVIANCLVAFARLVELDKIALAYPTVLARYGIAQFLDGRRVGNRLRIGDVLSEYAQRRKGFVVGRLDHFDEEEQAWQEVLVADRRATPADLAACRIDFPAWLSTLSNRDRRIAEALAAGHGTGDVAKRYRVSEGRMSQLRRELHDAWLRFHGQVPDPSVA